MSNAAINICVTVLVKICVSVSLRYTPRIGIAIANGVFIFK
jgi:hypothetical protein